MMDDVRRICVIAVTWLTVTSGVNAQEVVTKGFWENWNLEFGMDMSLQNPYGYDFSNVFPNGKTFGINVGAEKWFTPLFGVKAKLNWENGIKLLENDHANWLAPFYQSGVNMDKGGYIDLYGDIMLNLHNLFSTYKEDRTWNAILHPRAGAIYNFGAHDGSPLLGIGIENTYRLNDKWSLYADVAYNFTSSAVSGSYTGVGNGTNGYLDIEIGAQLALGKQGFKKEEGRSKKEEVAIPGIWSKWFVQAALDMTLQNPYGCNFANVFPNGICYGIDVAIGKWFTPEVALRGKVNWENGLIKNDHLTWVPPVDEPEKNFEKHGYVIASADVLFDLHNLFSGYDENRKWEMMVYPKAGIIYQFAVEASSPIVGIGIENTYRLNNRLSLYADVDYQVTTSEASAGKTGANSGSNGFFRLEAGVKIDL